ncbi:unnamed protein product [Moneuplotes crassus]|uniref:PH domain-containing protein n=1 Tax=Euplotes crassus TaxID=5936 RepID=A0AAD1X6T0_EUPCR|nr:unnamed protein product [Moneuplotes crassus]
MEKYDRVHHESRFRTTFTVYLDLLRTSEIPFSEPASITAGEIVERILNRYVEQGKSQGKRKDFSLYIINTQHIEGHLKANKNKKSFDSKENKEFYNNIDSVFKLPHVMKRKLDSCDYPVYILQRAETKMKNKGSIMFQWDLYFLSHTTTLGEKRGNLTERFKKEGEFFEELLTNITDRKFFFHRKGNCSLREDKMEHFRDITLILTGDHLYYMEKNMDSLNLILLSEALAYENKEKSYSFEIRTNGRKYVLACKSQHDKDNWINAILSQIDHSKCKHEIDDLEGRIQQLSKEASNSESKNPTRKQFLNYLEQLDEKNGALLKETIKSVHNYKQSCAEMIEIFGLTSKGAFITQEDQDSLKETIEEQATDILCEIFKLLKRAKMSISNAKEFNEEDSFIEPEEKNGFNQDQITAEITKLAKSDADAHKRRKKHFSANCNLDSIKIEDISVNHDYKMNDFKDMPENHQILLLCTTKCFLIMNEKFAKMKETKIYDKYLFKPLENNVNQIYRANFEVDFMKTIIWNRNFNKTITDSNRYLVKMRSTNSNIFKNILQQNKQNLADIEKKKSSSSRKMSVSNSVLLQPQRVLRSRRLVSVSTSFTTNNKEFEEIIRHKTEIRRGTSRKNFSMKYSSKEEQESTFGMTNPIQEAISEDEDPEEEKIDTSTSNRRASNGFTDYGEI